jgi:tRNA-dihydrouridine synthase C
MIVNNVPAVVLAPMDGITDAPMRALQGEIGALSFAVSEFLRVSISPLPSRLFLREVPELAQGGVGPTGLPVQVQILGGDPERMALSAAAAWRAGAKAIDINFGCPAPTVNRHDGGASLLQHPCRIREIVSAVRQAVPEDIAVSAKIRLGWDSIDPAIENAAMAQEGGASWITIHARTRLQNYYPPVYWPSIGEVRRALQIPVVANGDIWDLDGFRRCQDETGCIHFMIGRGALANPALSFQIARDLGISNGRPEFRIRELSDWIPILTSLVRYTETYFGPAPAMTVKRLKQWLRLASAHGNFPFFDDLKRAETTEELLARLSELTNTPMECAGLTAL